LLSSARVSFVFQGSDKNSLGTFTTLSVRGAGLTEVHSIVNLGYMAGIFVDSPKPVGGVLLANLSKKSFTGPGPMGTTLQLPVRVQLFDGERSSHY
jgi:hypothetical protein